MAKLCLGFFLQDYKKNGNYQKKKTSQEGNEKNLGLDVVGF